MLKQTPSQIFPVNFTKQKRQPPAGVTVTGMKTWDSFLITALLMRYWQF